MYRVLLSLALIAGILVGVAEAKKKKHKKKHKPKPAAEQPIGGEAVPEPAPAPADDAFKALDKDNDGKLSLDEYTAGKEGQAKQDAEKAFKTADKDNDGSLTPEEFKSIVAPAPVPTTDKPVEGPAPEKKDAK